ncbi:hypothetical protein IGI04_040685 [Brassica rapa subsp. trilocularis]|uniref:Uncharacterized protein n=1 Tax=Brassica rapa subsp. trilocularis TaxID=1813537 RepID=A0ABQ7KNK4_BRACM|nr:hypothetical protein IGI04_040685 [Brassica rapa subsp. trilocularis]
MGEGWFTLSKERFQTGEILFQPRLAGMQSRSVWTIVMQQDLQAMVAGSRLVLAGRSACLPGLAERLEKELQNYRPSSICNGVKVIPPCGVDTAWHGGKLIK